LEKEGYVIPDLPVSYIKADNKAQAKRLALQASSQHGQITKESLEEFTIDLDLQPLDFEMFDLGLGELELEPIDIEEPHEGLTDEDAVPEEPVEPRTKLGDVWLCGNHRVMCGDSTSIDAVEKLMAGKKADMVFTDPPYGMSLNTDYSGLNTTQDTFGKKESKKYSKVIGDNEKFNPRFILDFFNYCQEIFLWGADYYAELIQERESGSWVVWDKRSNDDVEETKLDKMIGSAFELCWSKYNHQRLMARVKYSGLFGTETQDAKKRVHPTQKPIQLAEFFFTHWGKDKNLVIDLFGGSGSTLIACEKTNRNCYTMELDEKYVDVIVNRWQQFTGKQATLESTSELFNDLSNS